MHSKLWHTIKYHTSSIVIHRIPRSPALTIDCPDDLVGNVADLKEGVGMVLVVL